MTFQERKDENMRFQWLRAGVVGTCCLVASVMICGQAMAADLSEAQYIKKRVNAPRHTLKVKARVLHTGKPAGKAAETTTETVGTPPPGFGSVFTWDRSQAEIIVVAYVNAADNLGPAVLGLKAGDRVEVMQIDGLASFSKGPVKAIESIIAVAAEAATLLGANLGSPGLNTGGSGSNTGGSGSSSGGSGSSSGGSGSKSGGSGTNPIVSAGDQFAQAFFSGPLFDKQRDGYGHDTGGTMRREEGGMLFCMPEADGDFYSGGFFDRGSWVQGNDGGERTDNRLPNKMKGKGAFFPIRGNQTQNTRFAKTDGVLNMLPWDYDFSDNSGFYRVFVRITRVDALSGAAGQSAQANAPAARRAQPGAAPSTANRAQAPRATLPR
jgi:uncharacterized membrane protein YgcG